MKSWIWTALEKLSLLNRRGKSWIWTFLIVHHWYIMCEGVGWLCREVFFIVYLYSSSLEALVLSLSVITITSRCNIVSTLWLIYMLVSVHFIWVEYSALSVCSVLVLAKDRIFLFNCRSFVCKFLIAFFLLFFSYQGYQSDLKIFCLCHHGSLLYR